MNKLIFKNPFLLAELLAHNQKGIINKKPKKKVKKYIRTEKIMLQKPKLPNVNLQEILETRKSIRKFSGSYISKKDLSSLLHYSCGLNKKRTLRFYPSAGARYPLKTYLILTRTDFPEGIYHYNVRHNYLEKLTTIDKFYSKNYIPQFGYKSGVACFLVLTSVFKRSVSKYKVRGYRYSFLEAGHIGQNVYLISSLLNIGCCAIGGGFYDGKINELLGIDGIEESVIYIFALGGVD